MGTCEITGKILDSEQVLLDGMLAIKLDSVIVNDTDGVHEKYTHFSRVENGEVSVTLQETETSKITYNFKFYPLRSDSANPIATAVFPDDFEPLPIADFHSIVPDLPAYEYKDLRFQTGITTQSLTTATFAVAKELLTNPNLKPIITESLGLYSQNTKPIAVDGSIWFGEDTTPFRYDANLDKWISDIRKLILSVDLAGTPTFPIDQIISAPLTPDYLEIIVNSYTIKFTQVGTLNGSNNYTISTGIIPPDTVSKVTRASLSTNLGVAGESYVQLFSDGTSYDETEINQFYIEVDEVGNPGNLQQAEVIIAYQFVK